MLGRKMSWKLKLSLMVVIIALPSCESGQTAELRRMRALGAALAASETVDNGPSIPDAIAHLDEQTKQWIEREKRKGSLEFPAVPPEQIHDRPVSVPIAILKRNTYWIVVYRDVRAERKKPTEDLVARDTRLALESASQL